MTDELETCAMTDHQGLPVAGYRPQTDRAVELVNGFKADEERVLRKLDALRTTPGIDQRWLQIGRTGLEQAFMAINRSVFQPSRVLLPDDTESQEAKAPQIGG
jgi:hypothetical protein